MAETLRFLPFPPHFKFGTAVASFQVEGTSGTRISDWDIFLAENPWIVKPDEIGPQWWLKGKAETDFDLAADLGMQSQRLSLEWARIEPEEGKINYDALERYHQMLDYLHSKKIKPMVTINHYTLPHWISRKGSWENPHIVKAFEKFTKLVVAEFGEVTQWITINEPGVLIYLAYLVPIFPPQRVGPIAALKARANMLAAHRLAYKAIKKINPDASVSMAFSFRWYRPKDKKDFFETKYADIVNYLGNLNYIDSLTDSLDFIGVNFYSGFFLNLNPFQLRLNVKKPKSAPPQRILFGEVSKAGAYLSDLGEPVVPDFFLDLLRTLEKRYHKPIMITENGIADKMDHLRPFYLITHLVAVWVAIQMGIKISEYLVWSIVDNLEWAKGYSQEFGLIHVNAETGERTVRKSAKMYKEIVEANGIDINKLIKDYLPEHQRKSAERAIDHMLKKLEPAK